MQNWPKKTFIEFIFQESWIIHSKCLSDNDYYKRLRRRIYLSPINNDSLKEDLIFNIQLVLLVLVLLPDIRTGQSGYFNWYWNRCGHQSKRIRLDENSSRFTGRSSLFRYNFDVYIIVFSFFLCIMSISCLCILDTRLQINISCRIEFDRKHTFFSWAHFQMFKPNRNILMSDLSTVTSSEATRISIASICADTNLRNIF